VGMTCERTLCPILPRAANCIVVGQLYVLASLILMAFGLLLVSCGMTQDVDSHSSYKGFVVLGREGVSRSQYDAVVSCRSSEVGVGIRCVPIADETSM
jgi:hypothetical protein